MNAPLHPSAEFLRALHAIVGAEHVLVDPTDQAPYLIDWRGRYRGTACAVALPADTAEVAAVVKLCAERRIPIVPQGGNTGLVGGSVPDESGAALVLSLKRMHRVRALDLDNDTITVESGCLLASVQEAAREAQRLFPLSLAAEGSCTVGGNLSTNAGGTAVLRYGNMRELVLGLEVVLPDGRVWDGLRGLRKDNTGYDLKQLFIGAEGTLGVVTAAVLKLFPAPTASATAFAAVRDPDAAVALLRLMRARCAEHLTTFELLSQPALDLVVTHMAGSQVPLTQSYPWYVLVELTGPGVDEALQAELVETLEAAAEAGLVPDAALAESVAQRNALWALRENMSEAQRLEGAGIKHDISIPVSSIPRFLERAGAQLVEAFPQVRIVAFGHLGDGNLHYNLVQPRGRSKEAFLAEADRANLIVHDEVARLRGSISAEHGLGQLKRDEIVRYKSAVELELMRAVKRALDPAGLMNPGKVL
jgi:FAD/FMN-containing dehydrogenase